MPKSKAVPPPVSLREQDPHRAREASRYENPLPSREWILEVLRREGIPVSERRVAELLAITEAETETFHRRLNAMERDGELVRNRRGALLLANKLDLIRGRVIGHPDGFGFLKPDDESEDLYLPEKEMHKVLHGDVVFAREVGIDRRGKREAAIVEVLERANRRVVGRLFLDRGILFVVAENKRINQDILVEPGHDMGGKPGQVVMAEIVEQPSGHTEAIARVVEVLGNYADPGMEIEIALRKHDLPYEFTKEQMTAAEKLPDTVRPSDIKGRADLRKLPFVTIDGETAKDFDDAVYAEADGKAFKLWVAIADVSHYVKPGQPLDIAAHERSTSVYFPRRVIPMLPEKLSNGLCSLKEGEDRLVMVAEMSISAAGVVKHYSFYPGVIHSQARLTYTQVAAFLEGRETDRAFSKPIAVSIECLYKVFRALLSAREKRGAIEFESEEVLLSFDEQGKISGVGRVERNDAHKLIEECMLVANVCAADFLTQTEQPLLYRVHEDPSVEKLELLRATLKDFGLSLAGGDKPTAADFTKVMKAAKEKPYARLVSGVMLRSMMQARYSPENKGHFGLGYEHYAHFTSPIRRYPDLLIHRGIKAALAGQKASLGDMKTLGEHCSANERRADEASRDVVGWLKCFYMQDKVNEIYQGTITSVMSFGLFVSLDTVAVDGLVHISDLGEDYFRFDKERHLLLGERTGVKYRIGDRPWVKVVRVDLDQTKIDLVLASPPAPAQAKTEPKTKRPPAVQVLKNFRPPAAGE